jgi:hypothetical protein
MPQPLKIQCRATSKRSGERCRRWAVNGALVCAMHGAGGASRGHPSPAAVKAAQRLEDAETELKQKLRSLGDEAVAAIRSVLDDPNAKAQDKIRAAETVLNRFVPSKAETKVSHDVDEVRSLDAEILEAAGIEETAIQSDAG